MGFLREEGPWLIFLVVTAVALAFLGLDGLTFAVAFFAVLLVARLGSREILRRRRASSSPPR